MLEKEEYLVTNDKNIYERAILIGHYKRIKEINPKYKNYCKTGLGFKHRIHPLGASLTNSLLKNYTIRSKEEIYLMNFFKELISDILGIELIQESNLDYKRESYFSMKIRLDIDKFLVGKKELIQCFQSEGLQVEEDHFTLLHKQKYFEHFLIHRELDEFSISEKIQESIITFPVFRTGTKKETIVRHAKAFKKVIKELYKE